jgi:hypothetical protein
VIPHKVDASKKIFLAIWILLFDFELIIGGQHKYKGLVNILICQPFNNIECSNFPVINMQLD